MNNKKTTKNDLDFEEALNELEKVVQSLEEGELTLEQSLEKFQKGIELTKICNEKLSKAEKTIEKLTQNSETGEIIFEPVKFEEDN